jgi:SigmaK-factor processing regulatory protein BofA
MHALRGESFLSLSTVSHPHTTSFYCLFFYIKAMFAMLDVPWASSLLLELLVFFAACAVVFIVFKAGKFLFKAVFGIIANSVLGIVIIFLANNIFKMGLGYTLKTLLPTAIFGIPGIGTILLLKVLGVQF